MFDDLSHFARFMGVSTRTAARWRATPTSIPAAAMRLLNVLELLERESPALLTLLIGQARKVVAVKPEVARFVPSGPYGNWVERPAPPEVSMYLPRVEPLPVVTRDNWSDSYWEPRTVASLDDDPTTPVDTTMNAALRMSDAETDRYWDSLRSYEQRTGRIFPN